MVAHDRTTARDVRPVINTAMQCLDDRPLAWRVPRAPYDFKDKAHHQLPDFQICVVEKRHLSFSAMIPHKTAKTKKRTTFPPPTLPAPLKNNYVYRSR
jgi:hypothetical protein